MDTYMLTFKSPLLPQGSSRGWICKALQCGIVLAQEDGKNGSCTSTKRVAHQNQLKVLCPSFFVVAECLHQYRLLFQFVSDVLRCLNHALQLASFFSKYNIMKTQVSIIFYKVIIHAMKNSWTVRHVEIELGTSVISGEGSSNYD